MVKLIVMEHDLALKGNPIVAPARTFSRWDSGMEALEKLGQDWAADIPDGEWSPEIEMLAFRFARLIRGGIVALLIG